MRRTNPDGAGGKELRRGDIHYANLNPVVGSEIAKRRPTLVVSNDENNELAQTVTVVPLTSQSGRRVYPFEVRVPQGVGGLSKDSRVKCDQIRTVDKRRLSGFIGSLEGPYMYEVGEALKRHLNLS